MPSHISATCTRPCTYSQGHSKAVLSSHESRTVENSAQFLVPLLRPDHRVLDVGCGPGTITSGLARLVPHGSVLGVDLSADVCARAQSLHPQVEHPNLSFEPYDILADHDPSTSLPAASFDVIFTSQTMIHLPDPARAIRNMHALLKPDGILAMRETNTIEWNPPLPGLDLYNRALSGLIRAAGGPGLGQASNLPSWAEAAGFSQQKIQNGEGSTLYSTQDEREWWSRSIIGRFEEEFGQKIKMVQVKWPAQLGGERKPLGEDGIARIKQDLGVWAEATDGRYEAIQCEIICIK